MRIGLSFRLLPGLRLRVSPRGVGASLGPRALQVRASNRGVGLASRIGPFYAATGGGRPRSRRTNASGPTVSELRAYERSTRLAAREQALVDLTALEARLVQAHKAEFPLARPVTVVAATVDRDAIRHEHVERGLASVPLLKPWLRDEARDEALILAETVIEARERAADVEAQAAQAQADHEWQQLMTNDPATVICALEDAFEDNDVPATALDVDGDQLSLLLTMPPATIVPERTGHRTQAGTATTRLRTKTERNDFYSMMLASQLLAAFKETLAVAPGIEALTGLVVRRSDSGAPPAAIWAGRFTRAEIAGTDWDQVSCLGAAFRDGQHFNMRGRTRELRAMAPSEVHGVGVVLDALEGLTDPRPDDQAAAVASATTAEAASSARYAPPMPSRIFVSYARNDEKTATALAGQLRQLETGGLAEVWFDRKLELGEPWEQRIESEVAAADIVLLLISPAYLASAFVADRELPLIAGRAHQGARVIPVILAPCGWREHPYISTLQAFDQGRELKAPTTITFGRQAAALVEQVRQLLGEVAAPQQAPPLPASSEPIVTEVSLSAQPPETTTPNASRVDLKGIAFKGSQLQTQLYVNAATSAVDAAVLTALGLSSAHQIEWVSPIAPSEFAEFSDRRFLEALRRDELVHKLKEFWPRGGPRWDALAIVTQPDGSSGVLLAEGKSYPEEMIGGGAKASAASRAKIAAAMAATQRRLGLPEDPEPWLGRYYQFANRLAHMIWLREQGVPAWLVHLCFVDDPHAPTDEATWRSAIAPMHRELGLDESHLNDVAEVFLPALHRTLLVPDSD